MAPFPSIDPMIPRAHARLRFSGFLLGCLSVLLLVGSAAATPSSHLTTATSPSYAAARAATGPPPKNTKLPTISGTTTQGQALIATRGSWNNYPTSYAYQWQRCNSSGCANISGATKNYHVLVYADAAHTIRIVVKATNAYGSTSATSARYPTSGTVIGLPPKNTKLPIISGTAKQGQTLIATRGSWNNYPTSYAYQWQRCNSSGCANISGATKNYHVLVYADAAHTIRIVVKATNAYGSTSATSNRYPASGTVIGLPPKNTKLPIISGTAKQGQKLTASKGSWTNSPTSYKYQWQHCDRSGVYCDDISDATSSDYTAGADDVGMIFQVVVTAANSYGSTDAVSSRYPAIGTVSSGTSLVWSDEFNGPAGSSPDNAKWTYDTDCPGWWTQVNQELECYTDRTDNVRQNGSGQLEIVARNESYYVGYPYTSGRILTQGRFSTTYGRFEARIKIPSGEGLWPAFWMLPTNYVPGDHWFMHGEIDVMESFGRDPYQTTIAGSIHGPECTPACVDSWASTNYSLPGGASFADGYHLYAIDWSPDKVDYYVDNALYATYTPSSLPSGAWVVNQNQPFFLLLNLAVGGRGSVSPPPGSSAFPAMMLVDYVRVYSH